MFYKVRHPKPWPFVKKSRSALRSLGLPFACLCPTFSEEDLKLSANLMTFSVQSGFIVVSDILGGLHCSLLIDICIRYCLAAVLWYSCPLVTLFKRFSEV